ncbi:PQQ-binding-like beta-propeller repeat protein [Actinoplanes sp. NPDC051494]|uniref:outer membrane protein assembly factor BamB family protein n=1 Tax=Actinoplanes sp. NPDC051494 TaxID=3363907 RepID=UPI0037AC5BFF
MTRKLFSALAAVVVLVVSALIAYRVLRPAEVVETATEPYPVARTAPAAGVLGKITMAPLIVDGRLRVYAGERLVKADAPVDAETMFTPLWSYRRWPEKLTGVVASGTTVVTSWDNAELVALDARTGKIRWRSPGTAAQAFDGRTGSAAVWSPPGLHVAGTTILDVDSRRTLTAHEAAAGTQLWSVELPAGCVDGFVTVGGNYVCGEGAWDTTTGKPARSWPVGPSTPVGCDVARSACAGLRDAAGQGWLTATNRPTRTPALDDPSATAGGGLVLTTADGKVTASGQAVWTWPGEATILGVRGQKVALLAADFSLVTLDVTTGAQLARFPLYVDDERVEPWKPTGWQLTDTWLAIERIHIDAGTDPHEPNHFYTVDPVILAAF